MTNVTSYLRNRETGRGSRNSYYSRDALVRANPRFSAYPPRIGPLTLAATRRRARNFALRRSGESVAQWRSRTR